MGVYERLPDRTPTEVPVRLDFVSSGNVIIANGAVAPKAAPWKTIASNVLRAELSRLLRKQAEVLESRAFGAANDGDILEYEIRQEVIHEICNQLANSTAA
jgi:hypothetical protein